MTAVQLVFFGVGLTHLSKRAYSDNGYFSFLSSDTQRILDRMDDSETYMNMKRTYTGSGAPSRDDLTCTDTDLNIRKVERLTNRQADYLDPTYSQLNFHQNEIPIAKEENPPLAPRPGEMPTTAQADDLDPTYSRLNLLQNELPIANEEDPPIASGPGEMSHAGPHKQEPNDNIGNGPDRKMSLLSMVTSVLFLTVVGLSIHVSQIRQSKVTCNRTDNELNSTLQSMVSALNSNLSVLKQKHSDLRHQEVALNVVYKVNAGKSECGKCNSSCKNDQYRFICEKSAPFCPDISEKIRNLCQQPMEPT
ncbi:uncharacterized protein LOC132386904 [Hypanus sabinus]|uniref:uncharacterized protein LOC132386904 n=1 Tax=Hypanus sabinus TaxID=79690 RepID=UPI0028C48581|nr:uncharacterized protein LOC132386904 [Hypanus sabinus]